MSPLRSLGTRLVLAFLAVSLTGTLAVAAYVAFATRDRFSRYEVEQAAAAMASLWAERYAAAGAWENAIPAPRPGDGHRPEMPVAVADLEGRVVIEGPGAPLGETLDQERLSRAIEIRSGDVPVGYLVPLWEQRPALPANPFMRDFYRALAIGGATATAIALLLAVLLSRSLRRPLRDLTLATHAVARGDLGLQIPVRSRDELGQLAEGFNRMSADLAGADRQRRQMTADLAHELRTPLSLIIGHAEAIQDGVLPASPETVAIIHDEARSLARLVDDLRTLSLADAGRLTLNIQPVSPAAMLERAASTYRPGAAERGITLQVEPQPNLPEVAADPDRVAQVLANLLSNALRHTPAGGCLTLSASAEAGAVRLGVSDTGPGIPPEDLDHIFDRFYRGDPSRHREGGGSGLGLGIARSLVERQGGRIWAESPPGAGATLWFTLPLAG